MATSNPLPPGTSGLPLLGETLPFMKDMFGFIRARTQRHRPVFRSKILGTPTADLTLDGSVIPPEIRSGLRLRLERVQRV